MGMILQAFSILPNGSYVVYFPKTMSQFYYQAVMLCPLKRLSEPQLTKSINFPEKLPPLLKIGNFQFQSRKFLLENSFFPGSCIPETKRCK